jgi:glycosyltransferase involved in cell wall biosynthesis
MSPPLVLVVPCFDEERRLPVAAFRDALARHGDLGLLFVDDGSRDGTARALERAVEGFEDRASVLRLPENRGKGEAVRAGLLRALDARPAFVGYFDADLATPLEAAFDMRRVLEAEPDLLLVLGSRLPTPGARIERRLIRHVPGRLVARRIARTLGLDVHDTQCGAKLFRARPVLRPLLADPFLTRWLFDVEILARLRRLHREGSFPAPESTVREFPLAVWTDVKGSKVGPLDFVRAFLDLRRIRRAYAGARA